MSRTAQGVDIRKEESLGAILETPCQACWVLRRTVETAGGSAAVGSLSRPRLQTPIHLAKAILKPSPDSRDGGTVSVLGGELLRSLPRARILAGWSVMSSFAKKHPAFTTVP